MNPIELAKKAAVLAEWDEIPELLRGYTKQASGVFFSYSKMAAPADDDRNIWYNPVEKSLWLSWSPQDTDAIRDLVKTAFATEVDHLVDKVHETTLEAPKDLRQKPWMLVKKALQTTDILRPIGQTAGFLPGGASAIYGPIGPSPTAAMLGGGLLSAGLGYGGGALLEKFLPEIFERNKLRKRLALVAGIAGTLPGLWWSSANYREGKGITDSWPHKKAAAILEKAAFIPLAAPIIPVGQFTHIVMADPNTPGNIRAMTSGLVDAASISRGGVDMVSPMDVMKIAVGAGSGFVSGKLVGRLLGALAGITPQAQQVLQRAGTWSGILSNTIPLAFGG